VSKCLISKVLNSKGIKREAVAAGHIPPPRRSSRKVLTKTVLRKIDLLTSKENPPSQKQISHKVKVSRSSVGKALTILKKKLRRKIKVHQLTENHKKNRRRTCKNFYSNYLTEDKSEFVVSLDEALFSLQDTNGCRKVYYETIGEKNPQSGHTNIKKTFVKSSWLLCNLRAWGVTTYQSSSKSEN